MQPLQGASLSSPCEAWGGAPGFTRSDTLGTSGVPYFNVGRFQRLEWSDESKNPLAATVLARALETPRTLCDEAHFPSRLRSP